jgi:hypothetical protein
LKKDKHSPLKTPPLRTPGQSLDEEISRLVDEDVATYLFGGLFAIALAGLEWWRSFLGAPPQPVPYTLLAIAAVIVVAWKITRVRRKVRALRLGRDGERFIGQFLETLREQGFQVFHDVPGEGFNVDHVIVGLRGVFTIETKTISKPVGCDSKMSFDGQSISITGVQLTRNPVIQAKAQARWLKDLIAQSTGRTVEVRPVVVFPGWYIKHAAGAHKEIWVLNHEALPAFIEHEREVLTSEDVNLISYHISRYVLAENA